MKELKISVLFFTAVLIGVACYGTASGQNVYALDDFPGTKIFEIDYAQFKGEDQELNRLEIYYKIFILKKY